MDILGQHVEAGDSLIFPRVNKLSQPYVTEVVRVNGLRAYDVTGNFVVLTFDVHVTIGPFNPRWLAGRGLKMVA